MIERLINRFEQSKYKDCNLWRDSLTALNEPTIERINTLKITIYECVRIEEEICKTSGEYFGENDDFEYDHNLVSIVKYLEMKLKTNLSKELSGFKFVN